MTKPRRRHLHLRAAADRAGGDQHGDVLAADPDAAPARRERSRALRQWSFYSGVALIVAVLVSPLAGLQRRAVLGAHGRAPPDRRPRRAAARARPHRPAAGADPANRASSTACACSPTRSSRCRCGRSISTSGTSPLGRTRPRCTTTASTRCSTCASSSSAPTCGCALLRPVAQADVVYHRLARRATSSRSGSWARRSANAFPLRRRRVLPPAYGPGEAAHGLAPGTDQVVAGSIMMVEESLLTIGLFCWLFLRAARENDERQELLDLAVRARCPADRRARRPRRSARAADEISGPASSADAEQR